MGHVLDDGRLLVDDVVQLARDNDFDGVETAVRTFSALIEAGDVTPTAADAGRAVAALRRKRQFAPLLRLAGSLDAKGLADHKIRRFYAQALIDSIRPGDPSARYDEAVALLERIVSATSEDDEEHREALGLMGRAWKQKYIDTAASPPTAADAAVLQLAIASYARVVTFGEFVRDHWHFINFVALTARAERDRVHPGHDADARTLASVLVDGLGPIIDQPHDDRLWRLASLGEAQIALDRWAEARVHYTDYMQLADGDAFELMSSTRQLIEVWQLKQDKGIGGEIVRALEQRTGESLARLTSMSGPDLHRLERMSNDAPNAPAGSRGAVEPGGEGQHPAAWLRRGSHQADAVGTVVEARTGALQGTGFLVSGDALHASLGPGLLFLTNSHVVGRLPGAGQAPEASQINFQGLDGGPRTFSVGEVVWESEFRDLDAALLRLVPEPDGLKPCQLTDLASFPDDFADLAAKQRACLIVGHAGDMQMNVTLQPCEIYDLGYADPERPNHIFIHHGAPTREGSSGSPVFNLEWHVIGLHRAGTEAYHVTKALGGRPGERSAKIAVSMRSIQRQIGVDLSRADEVPGRRSLLAPSLLDGAKGANLAEKLEAVIEAASTSDETVGALVEYDPARSKAFEPALKPARSLDFAVDSLGLKPVLFQLLAVGGSNIMRARRNYCFVPRSAVQAQTGLTFVSDGDSWFQFPVPRIRDTIDHLSLTHSIYCNAVAGGQLQALVAGRNHRLLRSMEAHQPDGLLLSGGGNDILGYDGIVLHVTDYRDGRSAMEHVRPELDATLKVIVGYFSQWIEDAIAANPTIKIFCHGYDWALPDAASGHWLHRPLLQSRGIADGTLQREIVRIIIDRFNVKMQALETAFPGQVYFVDCRGAVGLHKDQWFDELHPRSRGFGRVAARFNRRIAEAFAGDERVIGIV